MEMEKSTSNSILETSELNTTEKLLFSGDSDSDKGELSKNNNSKSDETKKSINDTESIESLTTINVTEPGSKKFSKLRKHKLIDSSSESDSEILPHNIKDNSSGGSNNDKVRKSAIIDTDSESENDNSKGGFSDDITKMINNISKTVEDTISKSVLTDRDSQITTKNDQQVYKSNVIDSDSDSENESLKPYRKIQFSDESTDKDSGNEIAQSQKPRKKKKIKKKSNQKPQASIGSSLSSDEDEENINKPKIDNICDSDSSSSSSNTDNVGNSISAKNSKPSKLSQKKERPPQRMSAKEADEQMKLIQSESQRLARETQISVPYHRPKQRTLHEFLNRKSINKPIPFQNQKKAAAAIKMSKNELETYAKMLDEREKESLNFFKSDSDYDDQTNETINTNVNEKENAEKLPPSNPAEKVTINIVDDSIALESPTSNLNVDFLTVSTAIQSVATEDHTETQITAMECSNSTETVDLLRHDIVTIESTAEIDTQLRIDTEELYEENQENTFSAVESSTNKNSVGNIGKDIEIDYDFGSEKKKFGSLTNAIMAHVSSDTVPSIRGLQNTVIDLETGKITRDERSGADELFQRFLKHSNKIQIKESTNFGIIRTTSDRIDFEKIPLALDADAPVIQNCKPRSLYAKLKETLGKEIAKKRRDENAKKTLESIEYCKNKMDLSSESESENESIDRLSVPDDDNDKIEKKNEDNENDENLDESVPLFSGSEDGENSDDNEDDEELENDAIKNGEEGEKVLKRIHLMDDDSDDEEKGNPKIPTINNENCITHNQTPIFQTPSEFEANNESLHDLSSSELLETSSTNLTITNHDQPTSNGLFTQDDADISESQLENVCSGVFVTQVDNINDSLEQNNDDETNNKQPLRLAFESSDEEETNESNKKKCENNKKTSNKVKKLNFSDDENDLVENDDKDASLNNDSLENSENEDEQEEQENDVKRLVEYDSEENEIEVIDRIVDKTKASVFFENEAELSESEWGSADEDERDLDTFQAELGDEDHFDNEQLQSELGKIHLRRVLDQDAREVKIIEDMLFEDDDGLVRERQFKWKNVDNNINLDDFRSNDNDDNVELRASDDENEEQWRKMRHERNLLLKEKQSTDNDYTSIDSSTIISTIKKKIKIIKNNNTTPQYSAKNSPFLINNTVDVCLAMKNTTRSSFLTRDDQILKKLATIDGNDVVIPTAMGKAKNFVFSTKSPVEVEKKSFKRKPEEHAIEDELIHKKIKHLEPEKSKKRLLDFLA